MLSSIGRRGLGFVVVLALTAGLGWVVLGSGGAKPGRSADMERGTRVATTAPPSTPPASTGRIGFGAPFVLSRTPKGAEIGDPVVAVSPTGSTAVMWREASGFGKGETYRADYLVATGPDAAHLSRPRPIRAARAAALATGSEQLIARPDGGFVACFAEERRSGTATAGCTFAPPGGRFGPLRVVARDSWTKRPTMTAAMRADGTLLVLTTRLVGKARRPIVLSRFSTSGRALGRLRVGEVRGDPVPDLATTTDGTVAVAWANGPAGSIEGDLTPVLRLMAPGENDFGPPVTFGPDRKVTGGVNLNGGAALIANYSTGFESDDAEERIVRRLPDGTFTPPKTVPRPGPGYVYGSALALPDGTPLAIVSSDEQSETDCGNSTGGSVGVGPLVDLATSSSDEGATRGPVTAERLSDPKQIAQYPSAALLADGTVIVAWSDAFAGGGRMEVAIRRPGIASFGAAQVLPHDSIFGGQSLAAGGDQALMAWTAGRDGTRKDVVVSALQTAAPFAKQQSRPAKPQASCS